MIAIQYYEMLNPLKTTPVEDPRFLLAVSLAHDELNKAEIKHPDYDFDNLRRVAIIAEEAGEAVRAALLQCERIGETFETGYDPDDDITHEVAQCAAMCLRYLMDVQR